MTKYKNCGTWDSWFLSIAELVAQKSKDPSTKVGAVIADRNRRLVSFGYNGFPKGVKDSPERYANRDYKLQCVIHAEENAILFADRHALVGATIFTFPFQSCAACASKVIQVGIKRVVSTVTPQAILDRWGPNLKLANEFFHEAGVTVDYFEPE